MSDPYTSDEARGDAGAGGGSDPQGGSGAVETGGETGGGTGGLGGSGAGAGGGTDASGGIDASGGVDASGGIDASGGTGGSGGDPETGGGETGGVSGEGGSGGVALVPQGFAFRRPISIEAGATAVPAGYTVCVPIDHAALIAAGKASYSGDDLRVFRATELGFVELDRVPAPDRHWGDADTEVCFATSATVLANTIDQSYAIYYGSGTAGAPPQDGRRVFLVYEDFEDGVLDSAWTLAEVGNAQGPAPVESGGVVEISGTTGNIFDVGDDFLFLERSQAGDCRIEACIEGAGGAQSSIAKLGGVMVRQSTDRGSVQRMISPVEGSNFARASHYRLSPGATSQYAYSYGMNPLPECYALTRAGSAVRTFYKKEDAAAWTELGTETRFTSALTDPVLIGIPVANDMATTGSVTASWFVASRYVVPEPTVALGVETAL